MKYHTKKTCSQPSGSIPELRFPGGRPPVLFLAVATFAFFLGEGVGGSEEGGAFRFPEAELLCTVCAIPLSELPGQSKEHETKLETWRDFNLLPKKETIEID